MGRNGLLIFILVMAGCSRTAIAELLVQGVACSPLEKKQLVCEVQLIGTIVDGDALYIPEVADLDRAYIGEREIGSTGYVYGRKFYARFYPRVYSLGAVAGLKDPRVRLQIETVFGDASGIADPTRLAIVRADAGFGIALAAIADKVLIVLAITTILSLGFIRLRLEAEPVPFERSLYAFFLISTSILMLSMAKIPRLLAPSIVSPSMIYGTHILAHGTALISLSLISFHRLRLLLGIEAGQNRALIWRMLAWVAIAFYANQLILLYLPTGLNLTQIHQLGTTPQIYLLAAVIFGSLFHWAGLEKVRVTLLTERIGYFILCLAAGVMVFDATRYIVAHSASTSYYFYIGFIAVVVSDSLRAIEHLKIERQSAQLADGLRLKFEVYPTGHEMLGALCMILLETIDGLHAAVLSIRDDRVLVLGSAGEGALNPDSEPRPIGPLLKLVIETRKTLFVSDERAFRKLGLPHLKNATLMVPLIQNSEVIGVISVMARPGQAIRPYLRRLVEVSTRFISVEALAALQRSVVEEQMAQMRALMSSTSGIVLENVDAWGRILPEIPPFRRIIVSADGIKSTHVDQMSVDSELIWGVLRAYKQEVYANWIALKETFELVSKDVRGDDFWVLTPRKFADPYLAELGEERVALIVANLIEERSRQISLKPEYQILARSGTHVSVSSDLIEMLTLGTQSSICRDVHAKNMSKVHRIRGEANPGGVLIDMTDPLLAAAVQDKTMFVIRDADKVGTEKGSYPDLYHLPTVVNLVGLVPNLKIRELATRANAAAKASPHLSAA